MFKIESFKEEFDDGNGVREITRYFLSRNGIKIEDVIVNDWTDEKNFEISSQSRGASLELSNAKFSDFAQLAYLISLNGIIKFDEQNVNFDILLTEDREKDLRFLLHPESKIVEKPEFNVRLSIIADLTLWNNLFSFVTYRDVFIGNTRDVLKDYEYFIDNEDDSFVILYVKHRFTDESIYRNIEPYLIALKKIHSISRNSLKSNFADDSIWTYFDFPEELEVSCAQYLLYFAQFLQDLGIKATSDLKEEAGKVLFSVTPTDDIEALDRIREALAVYLNLPASPIVYDESFAAMRLQQQIENLQFSQKMKEREIRSAEKELRLAQTVIEHQDKIIFQKDTVIEQQNKVIVKITSKSIMTDSLENKEELFEGLKVGESEFLAKTFGVGFNPITSLKTLGRKILNTEEENITVLGLNEEADKITEK